MFILRLKLIQYIAHTHVSWIWILLLHKSQSNGSSNGKLIAETYDRCPPFCFPARTL